MCRVFDDNKRWAKNPIPLKGEWNGLSSQGMPSKKNPDCHL